MSDGATLWPDVLGRLVRREDLSPDLAAAALGAVLRGEATDAQIAGFAVGLRAKGETPTELAALVRTMLEHSEHVDLDGPLLDTCGTGGDRAGTVNVSTLAALVAAAAGAPVVKHGNRAASSRCGSADVLEALGVVIDLGPKGVGRCVADAGIGFCFAPRYHPAMRFAGPVRGQLGVPTTFNMLGPLANPAGARRRTVGVSDPAMAERVVGALAELGVEHALVFYGHDGLDELTTTTTSTVYEHRDGSTRRYDVDPAALGLAAVAPSALCGGDASDNADAVHRVLDGTHGPHREFAALNAAAALVVAGIADDLAGGLDTAFAVLDDGRAGATLEAFVRVSQTARETEAA
ncbi:MAG TPA: anthranilate phosphoribosyltransferase [Acidimicrobiia bacterium]|jgi:anthranilate phosphoribosyltransferase|nr:anthranilate phosphoribosyltransferase [Acidimicrobiia bacterium]